MMDKIIDIHSHLGDNLYHNGGAIIEKKGVKKKIMFDPISISEFGLHRLKGLEGILFKWIKNASRERIKTATRENMRKSMDEIGITHTICLPMSLDFVTVQELKAASDKDSGIILFTGIDHTREYDFNKAFAADVASGALGLKLHPIVQCLALTDKKCFEAVEAFAPYDLPVLFHSGVMSYYFGEEKKNEKPEYGEIHYAVELVKAFPNVKFIAGHSGLFQVNEAMEMLSSYKNVWTDISFQSPGTIKKLLNIFGIERILFASDWPFGSRKTAFKALRRACKGDKYVERRTFYENAAELLNLPEDFSDT
jgi:predicted TIM-barrel fold metal-dependent hydrolase